MDFLFVLWFFGLVWCKFGLGGQEQGEAMFVVFLCHQISLRFLRWSSTLVLAELPLCFEPLFLRRYAFDNWAVVCPASAEVARSVSAG